MGSEQKKAAVQEAAAVSLAQIIQAVRRTRIGNAERAFQIR